VLVNKIRAVITYVLLFVFWLSFNQVHSQSTEDSLAAELSIDSLSLLFQADNISLAKQEARSLMSQFQADEEWL